MNARDESVMGHAHWGQAKLSFTAMSRTAYPATANLLLRHGSQEASWGAHNAQVAKQREGERWMSLWQSDRSSP